MNCANHNDVAAVAYCRTCGKPLCSSCTRPVQGVIYCETCLAARLEGVQSGTASAGFVPPGVAPVQSGPNPTVAGILGAIPFGVGAVYCGQYVKGLIYLGIFIFAVVAQGSDVPWFVHTFLGIFLAFFWFYQIVDSVRTAKALQLGQPAPDPFGMVRTFGTGGKADYTSVPIGALILIGLGVIFLLHTMDVWFFGMNRFWPLILIAIGVWLFIRRWGIIRSDAEVCRCDRCRAQGLMGPAILVTLGVLFLIDHVYSFGRTWPALLIVIGLIKVYQSNASSAGHTEVLPPASPAAPVQPPSSEVKHG
ncbi:MAG TPA: B-box zinc finger protein [Terriglobales bacterium]|jgi:hypothetical protein